MAGFRSGESDDSKWVLWRGDPDDEGAHRTILQWLRDAVSSGFLSGHQSLSNRVKGNLGEFVAYRIGKNYFFSNDVFSLPANADHPLRDISKSGIDIMWLHRGSGQSDVWVALQEVKTTGGSSLALADGLVDDYNRLFGEDVSCTLRTSLDSFKNILESVGQEQFVPLLTGIGGSEPSNARGVRIIPTLFHDSQVDSFSKMSVVRQTLIGRGWSSESVQCWSIALSDIDERLARIARG